MGKIYHLEGKKFNKLTVLERNQTRTSREVQWICKCECGNLTNSTTASLIRKDGKGVKSCGCSHKLEIEDRELAVWRRAFRYKIRCTENQKKKPCNLSLEDFKKIVLQPCFYCNKEPSLLIEDKDYHSNKFWSNIKIKINGIDRVDSSIGYIIGNCVACCKNCNKAKLDLPQQEFYQLIKTIYNNLTSKKLIN